MRLRTVMLALALLFAPVLADAGNPREPEFTQPANATVAGAAAVAGFGGWLHMADRENKRARTLGPMDHYMSDSARPPQRNAAIAAGRARAAVASTAAAATATTATAATARCNQKNRECYR